MFRCKLTLPLFSIIVLFILNGCGGNSEKTVAPWGEDSDSVVGNNGDYDLPDIINGGEMIVVTLSGPETYYDYHGHYLGLEYMLAERFAQTQGVSLRVDVCKDTTEMVKRLKNGDADMIAFQIPESVAQKSGFRICGMHADSLKKGWAVRSESGKLAAALASWFKPEMVKAVRSEENFLLSTRSIRRHIFSPMLNRKGGIISHYDGYFMAYSRMIGWDWRLLAAQCYQESTFDPHACSWAGARGLMQIMPSTAAHIGIPMSRIEEPESNIAAAATYLQELTAKFRDVPGRMEKMCFVLASYNGGYNHVRDAMSLARKYGRNQYSWNEVSHYVLLLSQPAYYNDPVVRSGYMRGSETVDYVDRIISRWNGYRNVIRTSDFGIAPMRAKHRNKKYR